MNNTNTTTTTKAKQITCGINAAEKDLVKDLSSELTRPAATEKSPDVAASEREVLEMALQIATNKRFERRLVESAYVEENTETGELREVPDRFETVDLFEEAWEAIKVRDYSAPVARGSQVASLKSRLATAEASKAALVALFLARGMEVPAELL